jgi:hypothetical protein
MSKSVSILKALENVNEVLAIEERERKLNVCSYVIIKIQHSIMSHELSLGGGDLHASHF